jgi:two-component system response regulator CpxR
MRQELPGSVDPTPADGVRCGGSGRSGCDILIVEDDELIREELAILVRDHGYRVETAANGQEALRRLESGPVGLVLLDLMMPVMSGWQLAESMHRSPDLSSVPILTITAARTSHRAPPGLVFIKPLDPDRIMAAISLHLLPPLA